MTLPISTNLENHSSSLSFRPRFVSPSASESSIPRLGTLRRRKSDLEKYPAERHNSVDSVDPFASIDPIRLRRWEAAALALAQHPNLVQDHFHAAQDTPDIYHADLTEYLCPATGNWPTPGLLQHLNGLLMGTASWLSSVAFGAVNLTAWNAYFPSTTERWMWRASALWIMGSGTVWVIINASARLNRHIDGYWEKILILRGSWWDYTWIGIMCAIAGCLYISSRLFLVVESFVSLRALVRQPPSFHIPKKTNNMKRTQEPISLLIGVAFCRI